MLKAALYLAGDRRYEKDLKAVDTSPIAEDRINSWSFYSDRRRRGFMLATFHDLFGNDPAGEPLAQRVAEGLTGQPSYYYNTQELVWGVTGLGKWVQAQAAKGVADGTLRADGAVIAARKTKHEVERQDVVADARERVQVADARRARLERRHVARRQQRGRARRQRLQGRRQRPVGRAQLQEARRQRGRTSATARSSSATCCSSRSRSRTRPGAAIQNIALVDRLPAGFEIENPRLGRGSRPDWVKDEELWALDFMNMRDDRLEAFGTLAPGETKKVVYSVRVVTSGKFTIPPVEAEAMYDSTLWARDAGGTAVVSGPWTGKLL